MSPHIFTNFKIQKYYQKELKRNGVHSLNNLSKIKDRAYIIILMSMINRNSLDGIICGCKNVTYFDSFGVENIPKEIRKFIRNENITTDIYRVQVYDSIICGYFCIVFNDFMLKGKSLLEYTKLFSHKEYKNNDKMILKYFQ